jgi:hypothetical protein
MQWFAGVMFWLLGAHAPFILKYNSDIFEMSKRLKQKIHTYIFTCYVSTKLFHEKSTCRVACVKKQKFGPKNKACHKINFVFFTWPQKIWIYGETLQMHIYYGDVHAEFFVNFFDNLKYVLLLVEAYASGSRIEFQMICTK